MIEVKSCPACWGQKVICVGIKDDLTPILEPCTGCDGTGWVAYKTIDKPKELIDEND